MGEDVEQTSNQIQMMLQAMQRIDQSLNEIQKIIKAIEDIAFQTNIFALNADIETAHASTAEKGFADEVRNLAGWKHLRRRIHQSPIPCPLCASQKMPISNVTDKICMAQHLPV